MKVKEVMTKLVEFVRPDTPVQEAAAKMKALNVGPIPVCEGDNVLGILTDRDIVVRGVAEGRDVRTTRVQDIMTRNVVCCGVDDDINEVARLMKDHQIRRVVVVDGSKKICGIVSLGDLAVDTRDDKMSGDVLEKVSHDSLVAGGNRP
jgi:CBS domain-containing protein